jgi:thymidylate synthase
LLLHLLAKEASLKEGMLVGFFADAHLYLNHVDGVNEILNRSSEGKLPTIKIDNFKSIFDWQYSDTVLENYNPQPSIKFEVAI